MRPSAASLPDRAWPVGCADGGQQRGDPGGRAVDRPAGRRDVRPAWPARRDGDQAGLSLRAVRPAGILRGRARHAGTADRHGAGRRSEGRRRAGRSPGRWAAGWLPRRRRAGRTSDRGRPVGSGAALAGTRWRSSSPLCRLGPSLRATPANWPMSASRWASPPRRRRLPEAGAGTTPTRTSTWTGTCASPAAGVYGCAPRCRGPSPSPWSAGAATRSWPRAPVGPGPSRTAWPAAAVSTPVPRERSSSRDRRAASPPGSGPRRPGRAPPAATAAWAAPSTWSPRTARSRQCCPPGTAQSTTDTPA